MASGQRGTTLEKLYIELGLDISQLQADILAADKTVTENLGRLNREKNVIKLRMEADIASLDRVKDATQILEIREKALTQQLALQTDRMKILEAAYKQVASNANSTAVAVNKAEQAFLREKIAVGQLQQQLKDLASQKVTPAGGLLGGYNNIKGNVSGKITELAGAFDKLRNATSSADGAVTAVLSVIEKIPSPVGKAIGVLAGFAAIPVIIKSVESALLGMAKPAIEAGDAFYVMSRGMQLSIADMAKLSTIAKVTGIDINEVNSSLRRFSAQVTKAGEKNSLLIQTMKRYGAELYDANGHLKNAVELSGELGKALKAAEAEGNGAAFRDIVGGKFWSGDFVTYLEDFADNVEQAKKVIKNGLANPTWAHQIQGEINTLNAQTAQLSGTFSSALMPVAAEIVPKMQEQFGKLTGIIAENKENIRFLGEAMALPVRMANELVDAFISLSTAIDAAKNEGTTLGKVFASYAEYRDDLAALMRVAPTTAFTALTAPIPNATNLAIAAYRDEIDAAKKAQEETINAAKAKDDERQARIANTQALNKATLEQQQKLEAELAKTDERRVKNTQEAEDIIFGIRHSSYEKQLRDIDKWEEEQLDSIRELNKAAKEILGQDNLFADEEDSVYELANAKRLQAEEEKEQKLAEIRQRISAADKTELEKRIADIEREKQMWIQAGMEKAEAEQLAQKQLSDYLNSTRQELSAKVQSLYQTELESRLSQIEQEKQAWISKCADEVKATELAEQQKADAQRQAAMNVLRQQAKEYRIYQRDGLAGLQNYKERQLIKSGVAPEFLNMTPQELQQFQRANQIAEKAILPNFMTDRDREMYRREMQESPADYKNRAQKYDDENYVIYGGKKIPLSSVTGYDKGIERLQNIYNEALGKESDLPNVLSDVEKNFSEMSPVVQSTTESLSELPTAIQQITEKLEDIPEIEPTEMPEIDSSGIAEVVQSFSEMPTAVQSATESLNELPTAVQGVMEQISAIEPQQTPQDTNLQSILSEVSQSFSSLPTVIQSASDSLNQLPITVSGLKENLSAQVSQLFSPMSESLTTVTVKFSDVSTRIDNVSSALSTFLSALNTKINQLNTTPNVTNNISIDEAHAWDYSHIQELAEKVADQIEPTILNAVRGNSNSYG